MALLKDYAIIVDARDNVAVVKNALPAGVNFELSGRTVRAATDISGGRVGTRNFILIVPTSMCASHESQQISTIAEFSLYNRDSFAARLLEYIRRVASGEVLTRAEEVHHREFQVWGQQAISL